MQNTTQNINTIPNEPSLADLMQLVSKQIKLEMNCHHIGTIESFDPILQTATATINYSKTFLQFAGQGGGETSIKTQNYPVLIDCPVICLGGGLGSLTFPIEGGDECLVLFNDRDIDNWVTGSSQSAPASTRLHAFADAILLVGLRSHANALAKYNTNATQLGYDENTIAIYSDSIVATCGDGSVTVKTDKITAAINDVVLELTADGKFRVTNASGELIAALNQLFVDIQNGLVTTMLGPEPLVMPTFATDLTTFQSFKV